MLKFHVRLWFKQFMILSLTKIKKSINAKDLELDDQIPIIPNHPFINGGKAMIEQWMKLQAIEREINQ